MKIKLFTTLLFLYFNSINGQQDPNWKVSFDNPIEWYNQSSTGVIVVHTKGALHGVDPLEKKIVWTLDQLGNIEPENYSEIENTPYARINGLKANKEQSLGQKFLSDGRTLLIDDYQGKIIYDSDTHPIKLIQKEIVLQKINAVFLIGRQEKQIMLSLVSLDNGAILWNVLAPEGVSDFNLQWLESDPEGNILVCGTKGLVRIDASNGNILWAKEYPSIEYVFFNPDYDKRFYGKIGYSTTLNTFDLATGEPLWFDVKLKIFGNKPENFVRSSKNEEMEKSLSNQMKILSGDNYVVADKNHFMATSYSSFNYYEYETCKPLWEKPVEFRSKIHQVIPDGEDFLVKLSSDNSWYVNRVNSDGEILWDKPDAIGGGVLHMYTMTDQGMLYMTSKEIGMLDASTGKRKFKPFKLDEEYYLPYFNWQENKAAVYQSGNLYEIDFAQKTILKIPAKIKFKGDSKALPHSLEWVDDGYFLANDQNLIKVKTNGEILYQSYYRYPGAPMWLKRTATVAATVAISYLAYEVYKNGTMGSFSLYLNGNIDANTAGYAMSQFDIQNEDGLLSKAADASLRAAYLIQQRNSSSYQSRDYQLVLTKFEDKSVGLIKVTKEQGEEPQRIVLNDKDPSYFVDDFLGILYYMPDRSTFKVYEVNK